MEDFVYPEPLSDSNTFYLVSFIVDGVEYANDETITVGAGGDPILWGLGIDGRTYPQNINDWLNSIGPSSITLHDNLTVIDLVDENSTYSIDIGKNTTSAYYHYDSTNFFWFGFDEFEEQDTYGTYTCEYLGPQPTPTPTPTVPIVVGARISLTNVSSTWPKYASVDDFIFPYPETDFVPLTLFNLTFNDVDYSNNDTLRVGVGGEPVLWGLGLDGRAYAMNLSDWLNTIAPSGITFHDNMTVIDLVDENSTFEVSLGKGGSAYYFYDQTNYFTYGYDGENSYGTWTTGVLPTPEPTPTPTPTPSTGSINEVSTVSFTATPNGQDFFVINNPAGISMSISLQDDGFGDEFYYYGLGGAWENSTYQYIAGFDGIGSATAAERAAAVKSGLESYGDWVVIMNISIVDNLDGTLTFTCNHPGSCVNIEVYDWTESPGGTWMTATTDINGL